MHPSRTTAALIALLGALMALSGTATAGAAPLKGVTIGRVGADTTATHRDLVHARALHANMVRVELQWSDLEPVRAGERDPAVLANLAGLMGDARKQHVKVQLMVDATPCWASSAPQELKGDCSTDGQRAAAKRYPPSRPEDYAAIAGFVASRFAADLAAFEVWNEPDQRNELYFAGPDKANRYAALLRAAYPAIKQAAPKVPVLAAAIVGSNGAFLQALYTAGIKGSYDGLSVHFYDLVLSSLRTIHQTQRRNGDSKPVWLAEFGWSSCAPKRLQDGQVCVSRRVQGQNLGDFFRSVRRTSWLRGATIFSMNDSAQYDLGLRDGRDRAKPAWTAIRKLWAHRIPKVRRPTLSLRRSGAQIVATGGAPGGDVYELDAYQGKQLRYKVAFRLSAGNRFTLRLPVQLGTRGLRVRVFGYWSGSAATRRTR